MNAVVSLARYYPQQATLYRLRKRHANVVSQKVILALLLSRLPRFKLLTGPAPLLMLPDYSAR